MSRPALAIDIDDVLSDMTTCLVASVSRTLGKKMQQGDITSPDYWRQYDVGVEEAICLVQNYNLHGFPNLKPLPGAQSALHNLSKSYDIYLITSRDAQVETSTRAWVEAHFAGLVRKVYFTGNVYVSKKVLSKADLSRQLGASMAIDDDFSHIDDYMAKGVPAILFGDYLWKDYAGVHTPVMRCKSWAEVETYFERT